MPYRGTFVDGKVKNGVVEIDNLTLIPTVKVKEGGEYFFLLYKDGDVVKGAMGTSTKLDEPNWQKWEVEVRHG